MAAKPVVVGVDGSEGALRAVEWAAQEAERRKAPLRIVTVAAMPPRMHPSKEGPEGVANELLKFSTDALDASVARAGEVAPGLVIDGDMLSGPPDQAIADSGSGAQLLVVGARGMSGFVAMVLGSVSRYVANHAACPVVVVRHDTDAAAADGAIVVGVRDSMTTSEAVAFAFEEAALRGADLVAVHAWHGSGGEQEAPRILTETLSEWRDKYPAVAARPEPVRGHPGQVLVDYSARAALVVIGRHGEPGAGHAIGSAPHTLLSRARGPVAIVPCES
jgi:nucleotide-binding universal stress UspA family protein